MDNINILWKIFKETGDIRYFNLIKKIEGNIYGSNKNRRDSNK